MTVQDKDTLKGYFNKGDVPSEDNFKDLIDTIFAASSLVLHASSHKYGGNDLVGTSTPAANAIPMAGPDGKLASGWLPSFSLDHGNLLGLGDDDHTQYVHNTVNRTISAVHTFSPVAVGSPFLLSANAQGQLVTGLRADQLNKSVIAGSGLTGGGLLTEDQTLYVDTDSEFEWHQPHYFYSTIFTSNILPSTTDTKDLGSSSILWRKGYFSELDSVLFAKNTISAIGGWLFIAKGEGAIIVSVGSSDTVIDFGQVMTLNDFVLFRASEKVEYVKIISLLEGTTYNVTRDLDGSGANNWPGGTPFVILGNTGNGRIELNAFSDPRISIIQQGSTYNDQTELIRIGELMGSWGYGLSSYGAAFGEYGTGKANITIDPTNGIRLRIYSTDIIKLDNTGAFFSGLIKMSGTSAAISIGATPPSSATVGTGIWLDRTGLFSLASNVEQVRIDASTGKLLAGEGSLILDINGLTLGAIPNSAARYITWKSYTTPIIDLTQIGASEEVIDPNWSLGVFEFSAIGNSHGGSGYWNNAWGEMRFKVSNPIVNSYVTMTLSKNGLSVVKGADGGSGKIFTQSDIEASGNIFTGQTSLLSTGIKIKSNYIPEPNGWTLADETWTYVSASSFIITGNLVAKYPKGTKLKLTNSSVKYFYVINAVYSSPNTTVTITGGSDYTLASGTISNNYFSYASVPQDFPIWFNWIPSFTGYSSNPPNGVYRFKIEGSGLNAIIREAFNGTSNAGSLTISAPVTAKTITNMTWLVPAVVVDNGNTVVPWSRGRIGSAESVFTFGTTPTIDGGFTSSNGKKVTVFNITYEI